MTTFPVVFGICLDAEAIWLNKIEPGEHRPVLLSHGAYAIHEGLAPLLDLLDTHGVVTTFFVPGITAEKYPDAVRRIHDRGHEIGSHGHGHKSVVGMSREEEREELVGGIDALETVIGERPRTWRAPSWEFTEHSIDLMLEAAVEVSTNYQDRSRPYRLTRDGTALPIVELPVHWHLADAPYFLYGALPGRIPHAAAQVEAIWREEFTGLYEDRAGAFYHGTLHVQLIGHPGRLRMLDRFLHFVKSHERARFMRADTLAGSLD